MITKMITSRTLITTLITVLMLASLFSTLLVFLLPSIGVTNSLPLSTSTVVLYAEATTIVTTTARSTRERLHQQQPSFDETHHQFQSGVRASLPNLGVEEGGLPAKVVSLFRVTPTSKSPSISSSLDLRWNSTSSKSSSTSPSPRKELESGRKDSRLETTTFQRKNDLDDSREEKDEKIPSNLNEIATQHNSLEQLFDSKVVSSSFKESIRQRRNVRYLRDRGAFFVIDEQSSGSQEVTDRQKGIEESPTPLLTTVEPLPTPQPQGRSSSGWDHLFKDRTVRESLELLQAHHTANAVLHLIELLATKPEQRQHQTQQQQSQSGTTTWCIQTSMSELNYPISPHVYRTFDRQAQLAVRTANLLTSLLMSATTAANTPSIGKKSFLERVLHNQQHRGDPSNFPTISPLNDTLVLDKSFFWALGQLNAQSDSKISGSGVAFLDRINFPIRIKSGSMSSLLEEGRPGSGEYFSPYVVKVTTPTIGNPGSSPATHLSFIDLSSTSYSSNNNPHHKIDWFRKHATNRNFSDIDLSLFNLKTGNRGSGDRQQQPHHDHNMNINPNDYHRLRHQPSLSSRAFDTVRSYGVDSKDTRNNPKNDRHITIDDRRQHDHHTSNEAEEEDTQEDDWVSIRDGFWTSPYLDCSPDSPTWQLTYSVPFFGPTNLSGQKISFKGVVVISVNLSQQDIDQCSTSSSSLFANTHKCHTETTECLPLRGRGLRRGSYVCQCKEGFYIPKGNDSPSPTDSPPVVPSKYLPDSQSSTTTTSSNNIIYNNSTINHFEGPDVEEAFVNFLVGDLSSSSSSPSKPKKRYPQDFSCVPCSRGCSSCVDDTPCFVSHDVIMRSLVLGIQSFCTTVVLLLSVVIFRLRREKSIASSRWIMIEMILFGAFLLYLTMVIRFFEPTATLCLVEPWLREVGFGFFYGSVLIKLYRILAEFQTRKAHRVCVRDKDLLKYLAAIIFVIVGYLAAWTALLLDSADGFSNMKGQTITQSNIMEEATLPSSGLKFHVCKELSWTYVTELGEVCFLLSGVYMTYCIRNARREIYREKWTLCWIVYLELVISSITYTLRHAFYLTLHPDVIFFLYFVRSQLTVTTALFLLLFPKLWYHNRPQPSATSKNRSRYFSSSDVETRVPDAMKLHSAVLSNGELDIADISLADMDPEEIRSELRRIYTQLQILKNKTMRKDNPHISKRRGGRKGTHRRFSLQPFTHKPSGSSTHQHHHHHDKNEEGSGGGGPKAETSKGKESVRFSAKSSIVERSDYYIDQTEISRTPEESTASVEEQQNTGHGGGSSGLRGNPTGITIDPVSTTRKASGPVSFSDSNTTSSSREKK